VIILGMPDKPGCNGTFHYLLENRKLAEAWMDYKKSRQNAKRVISSATGKKH